LRCYIRGIIQYLGAYLNDAKKHAFLQDESSPTDFKCIPLPELAPETGFHLLRFVEVWIE